VTLLSEIGSQAPSLALIAGVVAYQLAAGAAIGAAVGFLGALGLRRVALPASGLYPITVLALIVASYGAGRPDASSATGMVRAARRTRRYGRLRRSLGSPGAGTEQGVMRRAPDVPAAEMLTAYDGRRHELMAPRRS
jgi:hypothetical protein